MRKRDGQGPIGQHDTRCLPVNIVNLYSKARALPRCSCFAGIAGRHFGHERSTLTDIRCESSVPLWPCRVEVDIGGSSKAISSSPWAQAFELLRSCARPWEDHPYPQHPEKNMKNHQPPSFQASTPGVREFQCSSKAACRNLHFLFVNGGLDTLHLYLEYFGIKTCLRI